MFEEAAPEMVPYRFDERVSRHLATIVPRRRDSLASYECEALDELLATGPAVLTSAPADVSSLVRLLLTTCSFELEGNHTIELYGVIDFLAANTPPTEHAVEGALLVGDGILVDVTGVLEPRQKGAVYAHIQGEVLEDELYLLAGSLDELLGSIVGVLEEAPERLVPSSAPPRSSVIRQLVAPERRVRHKAG